MKLSRILLTAVLVVAGMAMLVQPAPAAPPKDTLVVLRIIDSNNYDPQRTAARSGAEGINMLGDTLVTLAPDMKTIKPGLAESWEIKDDGKTYIFHLRKDVKFHDGKPLYRRRRGLHLQPLEKPQAEKAPGLAGRPHKGNQGAGQIHGVLSADQAL